MRVNLHAKVRTSDGEDAGDVERVVIDPDTNEILDFVVKTGWLFGRELLVPRREIESATEDGEVLVLSLTKEQLSELPDFVPDDYRNPPEGWAAPPAYGYPSTGYVWPGGYAFPSPPYPLPPRPVDEGETRSYSIEKGADVIDKNGDHIGVVDEVRFSADSGDLVSFILRLGGTLETLVGGGETVEVPGEFVDRVDYNIVHLRESGDAIRPDA